MRPYRPLDQAACEDYLTVHADAAMFLRANLARGEDGFWVRETKGQVDAVVQLGLSGNMLVHGSGLNRGDWADLRRGLIGKVCRGANGLPDAVAAALDGLGLHAVPRALDRVEPRFGLMLDKMVLPRGPVTLRTLDADDLAWLSVWRADYLTEAMGAAQGAATQALARVEAGRLIARGTGRLLQRDGIPLAITAFNAVLPDQVQIGGVYTPASLRGRGHARRAVALHLTEARKTGIRRAVLFSASVAATRAYTALGFEQLGNYRLVQFDAPVQIGGAT